jgi:hypothetical protein
MTHEQTWLPIETAPRDGTAILAVSDVSRETGPFVVRWKRNTGMALRDEAPGDFFVSLYGRDYAVSPTRWLPIPGYHP